MKNFYLAQITFPEIQNSFGEISPSFLENNWIWLLSLPLLIIIAALVIYKLRPKPKLPTPYEKAISNLQNLNITENNDEAYITKLSDIIRVFLEEHYKLPAPERTTKEFLLLANSSTEIDGSVKEKLAQLLQLSDMVKFARLKISQDQKDLIGKTAFELLENSQIKKEISKETK